MHNLCISILHLHLLLQNYIIHYSTEKCRKEKKLQVLTNKHTDENTDNSDIKRKLSYAGSFMEQKYRTVSLSPTFWDYIYIPENITANR